LHKIKLKEICLADSFVMVIELLLRSIFGSNKIQRRLSDSDSNSDSESQEKLVKSSRQTDIGRKRATDVLTQVLIHVILL
jgi:hypothetical protein